MNALAKEIALKHLRSAQAATSKLWDEYYQLDVSGLSKRDQYKLVDKYHAKAARLIHKFHQQALDEINATPGAVIEPLAGTTPKGPRP